MRFHTNYSQSLALALGLMFGAATLAVSPTLAEAQQAKAGAKKGKKGKKAGNRKRDGKQAGQQGNRKNANRQGNKKKAKANPQPKPVVVNKPAPKAPVVNRRVIPNDRWRNFRRNKTVKVIRQRARNKRIDQFDVIRRGAKARRRANFDRPHKNPPRKFVRRGGRLGNFNEIRNGRRSHHPHTKAYRKHKHEQRKKRKLARKIRRKVEFFVDKWF